MCVYKKVAFREGILGSIAADFDAMMTKGLAQAKAEQGVPLEAADGLS